MKIIRTTNGTVCLIDDVDFPHLSLYKWYRTVHSIVRSVHAYGKSTTINMPRTIMYVPDDMEIDHINGDWSDNRRCNLRVCTHEQNMRNRGPDRANRSGYRGIHKQGNRYNAYIGVMGLQIHLGSFFTLGEALDEWNRAAQLHHGKFARLQKLRRQE